MYSFHFENIRNINTHIFMNTIPILFDLTGILKIHIDLLKRSCKNDTQILIDI